MRANEAIGLADRSMRDFKAQLNDLNLPSHIALVKDLSTANSPKVFKEAKNSLTQKLSRFYDGVKNLEKNATKEKGLEALRHHVHIKTGLYVDNNFSPSKAVKEIISQVAGW